MSTKIEIKHKGVSLWITERTVTKNGKQYREWVVPDYTSGRRVRHIRAPEPAVEMEHFADFKRA